jgi:hypothetical protein
MKFVIDTSLLLFILRRSFGASERCTFIVGAVSWQM